MANTRFYILLTFGFLILTLHSVKAQMIKGAVVGGFNLSQVDGDQVYGFRKFGANIGASAIIPLKNRFNVALEILYSQKGSYQKPQMALEDSTEEYKLKLNYAEIPVILQYADKGGFAFGAGISYGRLVKVKEKEFDSKLKTVRWNDVSLNDGTYNKNDFEIIGELNIKAISGFYLNLRYSYSLAKIRTRYFYKFLETRYQYNNVISFRLIWIINDKQSDEIRESNKSKRNK